MVKVYTTPTCPYCQTLKEFLKEHKIAFVEIDVAEDEKARDEIIDRTHQIGVPIIEIDDQLVIGFDKRRICQLLNIQ